MSLISLTIFQEYVEVPILVKLAHQQPTKRFMRSSVTSEVIIQPDIVQIGHFLAVKSENEEGLLVVKCTNVLENQFDGVILQKFSDDTVNILYKLLDKAERYMKSNVVTPVVSVVDTGLKMFSIDRAEIEGLLSIINE